MWTRQHKKSKTGILIVPAITIAFLSYFGFHAWHGQYGINSKYQLEDRLAVLAAELDRVRSQRLTMERRVQLLKDGSLERDMLDQQARYMLDLARPEEVVILLDTPSAR